MSRKSTQLISVLLAVLLLTTAVAFAFAAPPAQDATPTTEATVEATAEATTEVTPTVEATVEETATVEATVEATSTVEATAEATATVEATVEAIATVEATAEGTPSSAACAQDYVVQGDDWLSKLADKFYGDVLAYPAIFEATNAAAKTDSSYATIADVNVLELGWKVCIPSAEDAPALLGGAAAPAETVTPAPSVEATVEVTSTVEVTPTVEATSALTVEATVEATAEATPAPTAEPTEAAQPADAAVPAGKGALVMLNCRGDVINVDVIPVGIFQELAPKTGADCQAGEPIILDPGQYTLKASIAGQPSQGESSVEIVADQTLEFTWQ
jgi:hypothetical protein